MKHIKLILSGILTILFIDACSDTNNQEQPPVNHNKPLSVACVGDSITAGTGLSNPAQSSYPAQLHRLHGSGWQVENFGISGATVTKKGDHPYWHTSAFTPSHNSNPDIVVIMLGTNDAKPDNWAHHTHFVSDYLELINTYKTLPSSPTVYICYPPPVYGEPAGITNQRIKNEIIPKIREVASQAGVATIDIYTAMSGKPELFPDKVHPNAEGARQIAQTIYEKIY